MKYRFRNILLVTLVMCSQQWVTAQTKAASDTIEVARIEAVNVLYTSQDYNRFVGNMSVVKGDQLRTYPSLMIQEALAGRMPGLFMLQNNGNPGEDNFTSYVRGSIGGYITLVDGIERPLNPYDIEQIEEIRLLKDAVSKAMYGGRMSNGILMVTTKRGKNMKNEFHASVRRGIKMPTVLPEYLNAYDFATAYNQALSNDKISTGVYSQAALDAYRDGTRPLQYPNVDYYDEFLNTSMDITRVAAEYYGGNAATKYYVHGAYQNEGDYEKFATNPRGVSVFNLQGNLDSKFSDAITLHANFAGYAAYKQYPGELGGPILGTLSSRYPNAYPIFVRGDSAGGTATFRDNPYAHQVQRGYTEENYLRMQTDLSFDINLGKILKGLSWKPAYSFDFYHKQNRQKLNTVGIYSITAFNPDGTAAAYNTIQAPIKATAQTLADDDYGRRWGFINTISYRVTERKHAIDADLIYFISKNVYAGDLQDYKRQNLGLRANYTFDGKYTFEGAVNYVGSQSYTPDNRFKAFPALGVGWLLSKEKFVEALGFFDFLKLNASWGIMGDGNIAPNQWRESWTRVGNYSFNTSSISPTSQLNQVGNAELDWPKQRQIDLSLEATMFKMLSWKFSYFEYLQTDLLSKKENLVPGILGGPAFLPFTNYGEQGLKGIEAEVSYAGKFGAFSYQVGGHFTYGKSERILIDETPDPAFTQQGTPEDAIYGYKAVGTYSQQDIDQIKAGASSLPSLSFIDNASLRVGNIIYQDLNGDKIIDRYDRVIIGNNSPRIMYGADFKFGFKGIELYAQFMGFSNYKSLLNNPFYQVNSTRKYSTVVNDGLPNGKAHPQLTTGTGANDFQTSDYWIVDNSFLKLQNVALSYTLPSKWLSKIKSQDVRFFLYGTDLLTFSKIDKTDPESLNAGISDFPLFKTFAAGITVTF
ncbi:SusC/RagA family TonB-linked outer membrane protein [Flavitalea antarctica]